MSWERKIVTKLQKRRYLSTIVGLLGGLLIIMEPMMPIFAQSTKANPMPIDEQNILTGAHKFTFENIEGGDLALADYAGNAILLVNTASLCGFTPQYEGLQTLWETYRARGLVVIGLPSDDFGRQEPGSADDIKEFCEVNYGIDFPMSEKIHVTGDNAHPYYQWAVSQKRLYAPRWNFYKHLIGPDGALIDWFASTTKPNAPKLISAIEAALPR